MLDQASSGTSDFKEALDFNYNEKKWKNHCYSQVFQGETIVELTKKIQEIKRPLLCSSSAQHIEIVGIKFIYNIFSA